MPPLRKVLPVLPILPPLPPLTITMPPVPTVVVHAPVMAALIPRPAGTAATTFSYTCHTCGIRDHQRKECPHGSARDANHSRIPWNASPIGLLWAAHGHESFQSGFLLPDCPQTTEARLASARPPSSRNNRPPYRNSDNYDPDSRDCSRDRDRRDRTDRHRNDRDRNDRDRNDRDRNDRDRNDRDRDRDSRKGKTNGRSKVLFLAALHSNSIESSFIQAFIYLSQRMSRLGTTFVDKDTVTPPAGSIQCQVLLDTGSSAGDFISGDMLARLEGQGYIYQTPTPLIVKSGLDSS